MELNIFGFSYDAQWYEHNGARFKIRPYPASRETTIITGEGIKVIGETNFQEFSYCLVEWDQIEDKDGQPLPLTEANKRIVFDFGIAGITDFVMSTAREMKRREAAALKN